MNLPSLTVSQLNTYIKKMFDEDLMFASVIVRGEISNFSPHYKTGHLYFSLKDEHSAIKAVMFSSQASRLRFAPENGMGVFAVGRVGVFERDGVYQIYVNELVPDGEGALAAAFRQLKKRLEEKGLFAEEHKKPIPGYPRRIGIITSPGSAALQDMLNIISRRYPVADVVLAGVTVQGPSAPYEMIGALRELNSRDDIDVIIIGRGGGSAEDLWCFNDEGLARAIYESRIPVISAVGHETDFTICDYVSDLRAPTPSAAAELAVPDKNDLLRRLAFLTEGLYSAYSQKLRTEREKLYLLNSQRDFSAPGKFFDADRAKIAALRDAVFYSAKNAVAGEKEKNSLLRSKLEASAKDLLTKEKIRFAENFSALEKLNPLSVLLRGYSLVTRYGAAVDSADSLSPGDDVEIRFKDGVAQAEITQIRRNSDE